MAFWEDQSKDNYWSEAAVAQRKAQKQSVRPDGNGGDFLGGIGGMLGDAGRGIGNFFADADRNARDSRERNQFARSGGNSGMPQQTRQPQPSVGNSGGAGNFDLFSLLSKPNRETGAGMLARPEEESATDRILARLGERFEYDGSGDEGTQESTSALEQLLQSKLGELNSIRGQTNENFKKSDGNIASMHSAFQNEVRGQAPEIQARGDATQANIAGIFDKTVSDNNARNEASKASKMEMLQRLGIAPAANAPDIVGEQIARGNNVAQQGRDSRMTESATSTQTALNRNSGLANAIGNDGLQRRSDLNMRLQDVLGDLSSKEADYQSDFQKSKMEINNKGEDRAYERWLQDRQFDQGLFNSINENNQKMTAAQGKAQGSSGLTGINGLMANTSPELKNAMVNVSRQVDISKDPSKAIQLLSKIPGLSADEIFAKVTEYSKLGSNNKFDNPNAE